MKILVVSDTHRKDDNLKLVLSEECPLDMLIHLGDAEGSEHFIPDWVNPECRMEMVLGIMISSPDWTGSGRSISQVIRHLSPMAITTVFPWDRRDWWMKQKAVDVTLPCMVTPTDHF